MGYGLRVTGLRFETFIFSHKNLIYDKEDYLLRGFDYLAKAQDIAVKIYKLVEENEFIRRDFSLKDQFKSATISVSDNIAEGFEYNNNPDFYRFLRMSKGSCGEIRNKIHFVRRLDFVPDSVAQTLVIEVSILGRQIGELMRKVKSKIKSSKNPKKNKPPDTHNS